MSTGIRKVHTRACPKHADKAGRCRCQPGWEAAVWDPTARRRLRRTFTSERAAKAWQVDTASGVNRGSITAGLAPTLVAATSDMLAGMRSGRVRTRSGDEFKPSVVRDYERIVDGVVVPRWGAKRLSELKRADVQRLADELHAAGRAPSTIRNTIMPLRLVYRTALEDGTVTTSPLAALRLPAVRGRRDRIATPEQAAALLAALPVDQRAPWALGFYAGLRRGEILGLGWDDVDLERREIHVRRAWCSHTQAMTPPKSRAGTRTVPMAEGLRGILLAHQLAHGRVGGLVVAPGQSKPIQAATIAARAGHVWKAASPPLDPVTLHETRHTYASLMIAAGVGLKALSEFMGHASITITLDTYAHLLPGSRQEAAAALDRLLAGSVTDSVTGTSRNPR